MCPKHRYWIFHKNTLHNIAHFCLMAHTLLYQIQRRCHHMAKVTDLVAMATQMLHEQKFCDDFIRKYVAIWRKLQIYAQKYRIDEFSWDLARTFLQEEYSIDIEGDDIYSADCKKAHYASLSPAHSE